MFAYFFSILAKPIWVSSFAFFIAVDEILSYKQWNDFDSVDIVYFEINYRIGLKLQNIEQNDWPLGNLETV